MKTQHASRASSAIVNAMRWMCVGCPEIKNMETVGASGVYLTAYPEPHEIGAIIGRGGAAVRALTSIFDHSARQCDGVPGVLRIVSPSVRSEVTRATGRNPSFTPELCSAVLTEIAGAMFGGSVAVEEQRDGRWLASIHCDSGTAEFVAAHSAKIELVSNAIARANGAVLCFIPPLITLDASRAGASLGA